MAVATGCDDEGDRDRWLWENRISKYFSDPGKPRQTGEPKRFDGKDAASKLSRDLKAFVFFGAQATRSKRLALAGGLTFFVFTFLAIAYPIGSPTFFGLLAVALVGWGAMFCGVLRWRLYRSLVCLGRKLELHLQNASQ